MASHVTSTPAETPAPTLDLEAVIRAGRATVPGHVLLLLDTACVAGTTRDWIYHTRPPACALATARQIHLVVAHAADGSCAPDPPRHPIAEHPDSRGASVPPDQRAALVAVPAQAFALLVKVAEYVSIGRGGVGHQPDGAPYPDMEARQALGALADAGLCGGTALAGQ